ncbi:hypothetical protein OWV82_010399 [Melia azedarach]|uniref:Uncharacterized protein n=1 Tax=Melia azedarach TaxID=155640 RepID=A0ACC1Y843_MELAZ|nr:hypothetical protein OWV82_010399 [Melia azedarach]
MQTSVIMADESIGSSATPNDIARGSTNALLLTQDEVSGSEGSVAQVTNATREVEVADNFHAQYNEIPAPAQDVRDVPPQAQRILFLDNRVAFTTIEETTPMLIDCCSSKTYHHIVDDTNAIISDLHATIQQVDAAEFSQQLMRSQCPSLFVKYQAYLSLLLPSSIRCHGRAQQGCIRWDGLYMRSSSFSQLLLQVGGNLSVFFFFISFFISFFLRSSHMFQVIPMWKFALLSVDVKKTSSMARLGFNKALGLASQVLLMYILAHVGYQALTLFHIHAEVVG